MEGLVFFLGCAFLLFLTGIVCLTFDGCLWIVNSLIFSVGGIEVKLEVIVDNVRVLQIRYYRSGVTSYIIFGHYKMG